MEPMLPNNATECEAIGKVICFVWTGVSTHLFSILASLIQNTDTSRLTQNPKSSPLLRTQDMNEPLNTSSSIEQRSQYEPGDESV